MYAGIGLYKKLVICILCQASGSRRFLFAERPRRTSNLQVLPSLITSVRLTSKHRNRFVRRRKEQAFQRFRAGLCRCPNKTETRGELFEQRCNLLCGST